MAYCPNCVSYLEECHPEVEDWEKPCDYYKDIEPPESDPLGPPETIELIIQADVNKKEMGRILVADDPEGPPLVQFACLVQCELVNKLGWTEEIGDKLYAQAIEDAGLTKRFEDSYERWEQLAQKWAEERLND